MVAKFQSDRVLPPLADRSRAGDCMARRVRRLGAGSLVAALLFGASASSSAANYTFVDLGTLGGRDSYAFGINRSGSVVGFSTMPGELFSHAALWTGTTRADLGTLGGAFSVAFAINNAGQVAGYSGIAGDVYAAHATRWDAMTPTDLGTLGGRDSAGYAINSAGKVGGYSWTTGLSHHRPTVWSGSTPTDIGTGTPDQTFRYGIAYGINDVGQVVGPNDGQATVWSGGIPTELVGLSRLGSSVYAINNAGQIAGSSIMPPVMGDSTQLATRWDGNIPTALDSLGGTSSIAFAINSAGHVAGESYLAGNSVKHATLWLGAVATDLNNFLDASSASAGWYLSDAKGINDNGWITGSAKNSVTGETHAYLLTPVPEPASGLLALAGLGILAVAIRRCKVGLGLDIALG